MKPRQKTALLLAFMSAAGIATSLLVWKLLEPAERATPEVPFSDFLAEVHAGRVPEVHVDGTHYAFRVRTEGTSVSKQTMGPTPDIALVRSLRSSRLDLPAVTKVIFDR